ncbi:MAG: hypothetical protein ACPGLU_03115 [Paracoccaceae bacterium]
MKKVAVYIATTNGPVQIELVSEEKIPRSEVVLSGDFIPLENMSSEYHHFVTGSGPVSRAFGPFPNTSFHMELTSSIDSGRSWHLAALIAHGLAQNNELAGPKEEPDQIIWATGRLGNNFEVEADHLNKKLMLSTNLFDDAEKKHIPLFIAGPSGIKKTALPYKNVTVFEAGDGYSILDALDIIYTNVQDSPSKLLKEKTKTHGNKVFVAVAAGVFCLFAAIYFNLFQFNGIANLKNQITGGKEESNNNTSPITASALPPISKTTVNQLVKIHSLKPPSGYNCAEVHLGNIDGELSEIKLVKSSKLKATENKSICGVALELNQNRIFKIVKLTVESGKFVNGDTNHIDIESFRDSLFYLYTPHFLKTPIKYTVYVETDQGQSDAIAHQIIP